MVTKRRTMRKIAGGKDRFWLENAGNSEFFSLLI
jgi:hypothetical protein